MSRLKCGCTGAPDADAEPCAADATQEDFLCDHCRTIQCWTRTAADLDGWKGPYLCATLGCPEHAVPGGPVPTSWCPVLP